MRLRSVALVALVVVAAAVAAYAVWRETGRDRRPADLPDAFVHDVSEYRSIPPEKIGYRETRRFETGVVGGVALATGPRDEIVVGGATEIVVFSRDGARLHAIPAAEPTVALTVTAGGVLYAAAARRLRRGPLAGPLETVLEVPGARARITSVAVTARAIYVADAGTRGVWVHEPDGEFRDRIGDEDEERGIPGFLVPSPYFDVLAAPDGLLRIVDPGRHRVCAFTEDGDLELSWGEATLALEGFGGCCNPSHLAVLPDGRFVTSEKGIPRVKVHDVDGRFVCAVVGPDGLATETGPCDVAADSAGRILVLDPGIGAVRIFEATGGEVR